MPRQEAVRSAILEGVPLAQAAGVTGRIWRQVSLAVFVLQDREEYPRVCRVNVVSLQRLPLRKCD